MKKYLILILAISFGVVHTGVCAANPENEKSSPASVAKQGANSVVCEVARHHSDMQSERNSPDESEEALLSVEKEKKDEEQSSDQRGENICSGEVSEEEHIEPVAMIGLTLNAKEIVRSLQSGVGFDLNILEQSSAWTFFKRISDVYYHVIEEPALCTAPEGPALIVGSLHGDIVRTRESILAARIAFETGKAESVIFLGNYANRGDFCIETLNELLKFKLEFPKKVFLVSGSSEAKSFRCVDNSDLVVDLCRKFPKENVDSMIRHMDVFFKSLPVAIEVPMSTGERVLCLFGYVPVITKPSGDLICRGDQIRDFVDIMKRLSIQHFYTRECSPIFRSVLGLNVKCYPDKLSLESFLKLNGYKYLVKCDNILSEDIVEMFNGKCYMLNNSIGYITKAGLSSFCEDVDSDIHTVSAWNKCEVRDFVLRSDRSDPDVLVSLGHLAEQDGDMELARKYYEEAVGKGSTAAHYELGMCYKKGKGVARDDLMAVKLFKVASDENYAKAQNELGVCYVNAEGVSRDYTLALRYYRLASDQGYAQSQYNLGVCYEKGYGVEQDIYKAIEWYKKAAIQGHVPVQYELGSLYESGRGVDVNYAEAAKWYRLAANNGHAQSQYALGVFYEKGRGVSKNDIQASKWYALAAEQEHVQAQCELGRCYKDGRGVVRDETKAVKWYSRAADKGCMQAQYELGVCYEGGCGVSRDLVRAVNLYRMAADQGHAKAQCEMGVCCAEGKGMPKDIEQAVRWYSLSSDQGCIPAKCNLGVCYINGKGISKDYDRAVVLFREAAAKECVQAQYSLGVCYENGFGIPTDYREALRCYMSAANQGLAIAQWKMGLYFAKKQDYVNAEFWFRCAANQGFAIAQYYLGVCYEKGLGVDQSYDEAIQWYTKAVERGCSEAQRRIDTLRRL